MKPISRRSSVFLVILSLIFIAGGVLFYFSQEEAARHQIQVELQANAELKKSQIIQWRARQLADAAVLMESPLFVDGVEAFFIDPRAENLKPLMTRFSSIRQHYGYYNIFLVDSGGTIRFSFLVNHTEIAPTTSALLSTAWQNRQPVLTDLYVHEPDSGIYIDTIAPLFYSDAPDSEVLGAVVLQINAVQELFPIVQHWPSPSQSAETLLVRRNGDEVIFLNELRHRTNSALTLSIPIAQSDVPAVKAVLGEEGFVDGNDYRRVPVLAYLEAIPDSPWFMVAKIDKDEALSEWNSRSLIILGLLTGLLVATNAMVGLYLERTTQKELKKVLARQKALLEAIPDIIMEVDANKIYTWANPSGIQFFGAGVVGKEAAEFFEGEQDTYEQVNSLFAGSENTVYIESWQRRQDGQKRLLAWWCRVLKDETGKVYGALSSARDITDQRQSEEALRDSEASLKMSQRVAHVGHWKWDIATNKVTWSDEMYRIFGVEPEGFDGDLNNIIAKTIHPEDRQKVNASNQKVISEKNTTPLEYRVVWPDQSVHMVCAIPSGRVYDPQGNIVKLTGIVQDITERKIAEAQIAYQAALVASATDAIIGTDLQFIVQSWNPAAERLYGWKAAEVIGQPLHQFIEDEYVDGNNTPEKVYDQILAKGDWEGEILHNRKDGSKCYVLNATSLTKDSDGKANGLTLVNRDITNHKRIEQLMVEEEKMAGIGTLAAGIAHEINSPLQVITGLSEKLYKRYRENNKLDPEDLLAKFEIINHNAWRIAKIIRSLLEYARSSNEKVSSCSLNEIIQQTLALVEHQLGVWSKITVNLDCENGIPDIFCDPGQITQVLINLILNARDAMPHGGTITIISRYHPEDEMVVLTISDNGNGIPENIRSKIFDPFFTTKPLGQGTGLGLSIAAGIVHTHGGEIEVEDSSNQGTTFKIKLPVKCQSIKAEENDRLGRF